MTRLAEYQRWPAAVIVAALAAAHPGAGEEARRSAAAPRRQREPGQAGLFFEKSLSTPPGQACAACHDPQVAFANPDTGLPVSRGAHPGLYGNRNDQPVAYARFVPPRHRDPEEGIWVGGLFWDGRADTLAEQAQDCPSTPWRWPARTWRRSRRGCGRWTTPGSSARSTERTRSPIRGRPSTTWPTRSPRTRERPRSVPSTRRRHAGSGARPS